MRPQQSPDSLPEMPPHPPSDKSGKIGDMTGKRQSCPRFFTSPAQASDTSTPSRPPSHFPAPSDAARPAASNLYPSPRLPAKTESASAYTSHPNPDKPAQIRECTRARSSEAASSPPEPR